eukprot:1094060-Pleurochrysis_carterae.AAC.2
MAKANPAANKHAKAKMLEKMHGMVRWCSWRCADETTKASSESGVAVQVGSVGRRTADSGVHGQRQTRECAIRRHAGMRALRRGQAKALLSGQSAARSAVVALRHSSVASSMLGRRSETAIDVAASSKARDARTHGACGAAERTRNGCDLNELPKDRSRRAESGDL